MGKEDALALTSSHAPDHAAQTISRRFETPEAARQGHRGIIAAVELLAETGMLPEAFRPHRLSGEWKGVWECNIEPDWLLIYDVTPAEVLLIRTGSHSDLFE
jgi:mRNA interferase YafQ